jgi:hypothetical protein
MRMSNDFVQEVEQDFFRQFIVDYCVTLRTSG